MQKDLRQLWKQTDKAAAAAHPEDWLARAEASGIPTLQKFAKTLAVNGFGIWADNDYPFSPGPLPGHQNKIKTLERQSSDFRDHEWFSPKILVLHETRYASVG